MTTSDPTPVVEVKRFHEAYPGMPLLYHTYCSACPNYGICGKREAAESDAWRHAQSHGTTVPPNDPKCEHGISLSDLCEYASHRANDPTHEHPEHGGHETPEAEAARRYPKRGFVQESYVQNAFIAGAEWQASHVPPTPGDHEALIARLGELAGRLVGFPGWHDVHDAIAALRTEQSARQAAEERERVLIAGVKEAQQYIEARTHPDDWGVPCVYVEDLNPILSRLLPSAPTEEGTNDDHS